MRMSFNKQYLQKIKSVLPLFTIVAWSSVLVLALVRWCFFLGKYPVLNVNEEMWELYIPAFISVVPIWYWMKFKELDFRKNQRHGAEQLQLIGYFTLFGMLAVSQAYISTFGTELVVVKDVKQIQKMEEARYYRIDTFAVHRPIGGVYYASRVDGRFRSNLRVEVYFVNPILTHKRQILTMTPLYWYGVKFDKKISNWVSNEEKQKRFRAFYQECLNKMLQYDFQKLDHFERIPTSHDRENFGMAVENALRKRINKDFVILEAKTKVFENKNRQKVAWTFFIYLIGCGIYMLALIKPGFRNESSEEATEPVDY